MAHRVKLIHGDKSSPTSTLNLAGATTANIVLGLHGFFPAVGPREVNYAGRLTRYDGERRNDSTFNNVQLPVTILAKGSNATEVSYYVREIEKFALFVRQYWDFGVGDKSWLEVKWNDPLSDVTAAPVYGQWAEYYLIKDIEIERRSENLTLSGSVMAFDVLITCAPFREGLKQKLFDADGLPDVDSDVAMTMTLTDSELASDFTVRGWIDHVASDYHVFEYYVDANNYVNVFWDQSDGRFEINSMVSSSLTTTNGDGQSLNAGDPILVALVQDHTGDSDTTLYINGTAQASLGTSNAWANNGSFVLGSSISTAGTAQTSGLDDWQVWATDFTAAQISALYTAQEVIKDDGLYISQPAYLKTRSGDGVFENVDGVLSAAAKDNWGVAGWVPGQVEAITEWHIEPDTSGNEYVHWLGRKAVKETFTPDATLWLDFSGTTDTGNSSGDAYEPSASTEHVFDKTQDEPGVLKGEYTAFARMQTNAALTVTPYYKLGLSDRIEFDNNSLAESANWNLYKLGLMAIDWPQPADPPTIEAGLRSVNSITLWDDLVSFWRLEESSGTRSDEFASNDLTDNNTVGQSSGKLGNAASFVAANSEYLSIADGSQSGLSPGDADFHVTFWVKFTSLSASFMAIVGKQMTTGNNREYYVYYANSTNRLILEVSSDGSTSTALTASTFGAPSTGVWYFVEFYHDSVNDVIGIGVNGGTRDTAAHSSGVYEGTGPFTIGSTGNPHLYLDGEVDAVGFFDAILTTAQIDSLYNSGTGLEYTSALAGNLDFVHLLPKPSFRVENEDSTPSYASGDTLVVAGRHAYVLDASDSDSQLNLCYVEGDEVRLVPEHYNYIFLVQGVESAAYTVGNEATVSCFVTPRYGVLGSMV